MKAVLSNRWFVLAVLWFAGSLYALFFRDGSADVPPFPYFDKVCHFALFFGQFWLCAKSFFSVGRAVPWRILLAAALVWAGASEVAQGVFTATREADVWDAAADTAGAAAALVLACRVAQARRNQKGCSS